MPIPAVPVTHIESDEVFGQRTLDPEDAGAELDGTESSYVDGSNNTYDVLKFTLGSGESSIYFKTYRYSRIVVVAAGAGQFDVPNDDYTATRKLDATGVAMEPTSTKAGILHGVAIPHMMRVTDTSSGSNVVVLYGFK